MASDAASTETEAAQGTVFLSYSRDDRKRALPLIKAIEDAGFKVWWDGLLGGGERYSITTQEALEGARAVVVLWSGISINSHWVHDEATRGRDRGVLVPVSIDGTKPPLGFGQFQTIDLGSGAKLRQDSPGMVSLIAALAALHGPGQALPQREPAKSRGVDRRLALAGLGTLAAAGVGTAWWRGWLGGAQQESSVAVLPFANLSGDPQQEYFSDGVAAEIRTTLARNPMLKVAAQISSESFRDRRVDAKTMTSKLGVTYLLDGNIRKAGDTIRVAVELTDGTTGFSRWAEQFNRPAADLFAVQDEIAAAVAAALSAELNGGPEPHRGTTNLAAYDAYLKGKALYQLSTGEQSSRDALAKFEEAIELDPSYAAAWSARSRTIAAIANQNLKGQERAGAFEQAITAANRAIELDRELADAYSALGFATFFGRRNAREARAPFKQSAKLGQNESDVLTRYAIFCARTGDFAEARTAIQRASKLDPLNPLALRTMGTVEYVARDYPAAIAATRRALTLNPELSGANAAIGMSQVLQGQLDDAAKSFAAEKSSLRRLTGQAVLAGRKGDKTGMEAALRAVETEFGDSALYEQAQILAQSDDRDRAMATLLRAAATGDPGLMLIQTDPLIDPLRERPEFSGLLRQAGLV
ncbi:MAG: TIR domain-containing protein [Novosphingobium sp.]|jgi:TolB-like protein/Flp pilus assembly protein TadD|uniref:TIR domain-containing protein n=1 Tax=Novosphingobium sp. TaxID=1874826 RepID=UPI003919F635|nr:TIR domain-containing protein [Novosphingobium sp.]